MLLLETALRDSSSGTFSLGIFGSPHWREDDGESSDPGSATNGHAMYVLNFFPLLLFQLIPSRLGTTILMRDEH
jgi:hypothetical protein